MSLTYTQITETWDDGTGQPLSNLTVSFAPSATVYAAGVPVVSPGSPVVAQVVNGALKSPGGGTLQLLATDNAGLTIEGRTGFWYWTVSIGGAITDSWSFFLPSSPGTVDLYSLANTVAGGGGSGFANPMTTLGDLIYENATPAAARLAGNATSTKKFLTQTGTGSVSAAPAWGTLVAGDVPTLNQSTTGNAATATNLAGGATLPAYLAPAVSALTDGATIAVNAALGNVFTVTLGGNRTLSNPTNPVAGQTIHVHVTQDGTGSRTLSYGTAYDFGTAGSPTLTTTAGKMDILGFTYDGGLSKWCYLGAGLAF